MTVLLQEQLGRPRTAVVVGALTPAQRAVLEQRCPGCVDTGAPTDAAVRSVAGRRFDLAVVCGWLTVEEWTRALRAAREVLEDGGHVLVLGRLGSLEVPSALVAADLELLRQVGPPDSFAERVVTSVAAAARARWDGARGWDALHRVAAGLRGRTPDAAHALWVARKPPKPGPLSLTVGMLTLNEEQSVARMVQGIRSVVPDARILLVDSSSDRTPEMARELGARVVRQVPAQGHGPAMERLMYEAAQESDALVCIDCDGTYPLEAISTVRAHLERGADLVNATRITRSPKTMPRANLLANRVMAASVRVAHGLPTSDVHSGLRGFRSSMVRGFAFDGSGDGLPLDTLILPARSNYRVVEFPIDYFDRTGASKNHRVRGVAWTYRRILGAFAAGRRVTPNAPNYRVLEAEER